MTKVLVLATSRKTRGGVTSVVKAHEQGEQWKKYRCKWIETHRDNGLLVKFLMVIHAFIQYVFLLPFYDLVHIHTSEPPSALRKVPFMWWAKVWRKKTIVHFHSFSPETTIRSRFACLYRYLFGKADRVVVLSEYWKSEVMKEMPSAKVVVIHNPCLAEVKELAVGCVEYNGASPKIHSILYAGTVNHLKGYADMVKAFAKIAKNHPDWQIVFAGNGEIEQGKALAESLGISNQTKWLGWVRDEDKDKAFREATIFCLPSYAEGFPMSVLDAWSYGLPVITTPVGGIPDVAKDRENMLLFNPGDVDALSECMEQMITDKELRDRISRASLEFARKRFNIDKINGEVEKLYAEVLNTMKLKDLCILESKEALASIPHGKKLINTINAHSFNTAKKDELFAEALMNGDYLIPDGASIVKACRWVRAKSRPKERIAGWDLFEFEMKAPLPPGGGSEEGRKKRVMFMGSSENVLELIRKKAAEVYPNIEVVTYSPPYKPEFSDEDNRTIVEAINKANPDLLWIGMTAPKQEKWTYSHWNELDIHCHVGTIGVVFDFFAGTRKRAPQWWQEHSLEWLYRLIKEPKRMWRRYVLGNPLFLWNIVRELI